MSRILLVTDDARIGHQVGVCAADAGASLAERPSLDTATSLWGQADLVLLGADLAADASTRPVCRTGALIIVSAELDQPAVFDHARDLMAAFIAFLPAGVGWLTDLLQRPTGASGGPTAGNRFAKSSGAIRHPRFTQHAAVSGEVGSCPATF